jgi:peptidoglycan/LPS O-acetylase OafA/YrhL
MKHIKQLDAVRAIAVILVLLWHWFPPTHGINRVPNGPIGVNMFFVLSGFLITRILMEDRIKAEKAGLPGLMVFKNFFIRRALRIFPIYYLTIFTLWGINGFAGTNIEPNIRYFLTYTSNFYFFHLQSWDGILSHTWSLAIEEQFYLVWPWAILFLNRKWLLPLIVCCLATGIISQYAIAGPFAEVLPVTCLHTFGLGALLSWIIVFKPFALAKVYKVLTMLMIPAALIFSVEVMAGNWKLVPVRLLTAVFTGWLIAFILLRQNRIPGPMALVLNNKFLIFLGRISYGIYLYHAIIPHYTVRALTRLNKHIPVVGGHLLFMEQCIVVTLVAYTSWRLIESPVLTLKKHFVLPRKAVIVHEKKPEHYTSQSKIPV